MIALSLVQLVASVTLVHASCPAYQQHFSCYVPETQTIYITARDEGSREVLLHEYGHAYDFQRLNDSQRASIKRLLGYPASRGWWKMGPNQRLSPGEQFADDYAHCAMGSFPYYATKREAKICVTLLASAAGTVARRVRVYAADGRTLRGAGQFFPVRSPEALSRGELSPLLLNERTT